MLLKFVTGMIGVPVVWFLRGCAFLLAWNLYAAPAIHIELTLGVAFAIAVAGSVFSYQGNEDYEEISWKDIGKALFKDLFHPIMAIFIVFLTHLIFH